MFARCVHDVRLVRDSNSVVWRSIERLSCARASASRQEVTRHSPARNLGCVSFPKLFFIPVCRHFASATPTSPDRKHTAAVAGCQT